MKLNSDQESKLSLYLKYVSVLSLISLKGFCCLISILKILYSFMLLLMRDVKHALIVWNVQCFASVYIFFSNNWEKLKMAF